MVRWGSAAESGAARWRQVPGEQPAGSSTSARRTESNWRPGRRATVAARKRACRPRSSAAHVPCGGGRGYGEGTAPSAEAVCASRAFLPRSTCLHGLPSNLRSRAQGLGQAGGGPGPILGRVRTGAGFRAAALRTLLQSPCSRCSSSKRRRLQCNTSSSLRPRPGQGSGGGALPLFSAAHRERYSLQWQA
jgi:hypothetical protein